MAGLEVERWLQSLAHDLDGPAGPAGPAGAPLDPHRLNAAWVAEQRLARLLRRSGEYDGEPLELGSVGEAPGGCGADGVLAGGQRQGAAGSWQLAASSTREVDDAPLSRECSARCPVGHVGEAAAHGGEERAGVVRRVMGGRSGGCRGVREEGL